MLILIICASLLGGVVSSYLFYKKSQKKKLFCPLRTQCDKVLYSTHARTFGFPNEALGMVVYGVFFLFSLFSLFIPSLWTPEIHYVFLFVSTAGMLFSLYLVVLQAFVIRAWCMWCIMSFFAQIGILIALLGFSLSDVQELAFLHRDVWIILHTLGFVIGLGAVTVTDIFFFRFLKDNRITFEEKGNLDTLTRVIWGGLGVLVVSGVFLVLGDSTRLLSSSKFLLKTIVVAVVVINGIVLNFYLSPRLQYMTLEGQSPERGLRKRAFALGGISLFSWYTAFFLGSFRSIPLSLERGLMVYIFCLFCIVVISQIVESYLNKKNA